MKPVRSSHIGKSTDSNIDLPVIEEASNGVKRYRVFICLCFIFFFCIATTPMFIGAVPFGVNSGIGSYVVATIAGSGIKGFLDGS
ncbi:MAG TPA: hypothetical protein VJZ92_03835, partial [Thermodesulfobacteriota bacterium]|nr:hypothetical protein [Thermodesulfobacteriota bacterium]